MSDSNDKLIAGLRRLHLSRDEALIYLELLREPSTHLRLSRGTGVARTKVYRLIEQLEKRSLVARRTDDRGTFLVAADPSSLEIELVARESYLKQQRATLKELVPALATLQTTQDNTFVVRTYEGNRGFRQMCWHELKSKTDVLSLGGGTIEELIVDHRWAERHRALSVEAGYKVRELVNFGVDMPTFTSNRRYIEKQYSCRGVPREAIPFDNQTVIYNDTVAIYHHRHEKKVGVEIISQSYADMMRAIFEYYWAQGAPFAAS